MSLNIRLARAEDVPVLEELFLEFSNWQLQRGEAIRRAMKDPDGELLVAECDGLIVAFIHQIFFHDPLHAGLNSTITSLFVKENQRGKGIASKLLQRTLDSARKRMVVEVHADTEETNEKAMKLYEKNGFKKVGVMFEANP